jgi:hypothetical protein
LLNGLQTLPLLPVKLGQQQHPVDLHQMHCQNRAMLATLVVVVVAALLVKEEGVSERRGMWQLD